MLTVWSVAGALQCTKQRSLSIKPLLTYLHSTYLATNKRTYPCTFFLQYLGGLYFFALQNVNDYQTFCCAVQIKIVHFLHFNLECRTRVIITHGFYISNPPFGCQNIRFLEEIEDTKKTRQMRLPLFQPGSTLLE